MPPPAEGLIHSMYIRVIDYDTCMQTDGIPTRNAMWQSNEGEVIAEAFSLCFSARRWHEHLFVCLMPLCTSFL